MRPELQVVLQGMAPDGKPWSVLAGFDPDDERTLWTFVRRERPDGRAAQSGMGGPGLHPGQVVNIWAGQSDGTPPYVLVRGVPGIESVTVTTRGGTVLPLTLSPTIDAFALRFGAAALPEGDEPRTLTVRLADGRTLEGRVPWRRPPPPGRGRTG